MLAESTDNIPAFFPAPGVLKQLVYNALLRLPATLALGIRNLYKSLIYPFDCERLWLSQCKALLLLRFKRHIARISILVVDTLKCSAIKPTDLFEGF